MQYYGCADTRVSVAVVTVSTSAESASLAATASSIFIGSSAERAASPSVTSLVAMSLKLVRAPSRAQVTDSLSTQLSAVGFSGPTLFRIEAWRAVLQAPVALA